MAATLTVPRPYGTISCVVPAEGELRITIDSNSSSQSSANDDSKTSSSSSIMSPDELANGAMGSGGSTGGASSSSSSSSSHSSAIGIELVSGTAECFGTEMAVGKEYIFRPGDRAALFTWHGCTLKFWGPSVRLPKGRAVSSTSSLASISTSSSALSSGSSGPSVSGGIAAGGDGKATKKALDALLGSVPDTRADSGSSGGVHWYVATETPMTSYVNVYALLEAQREGKRPGATRTPVCVVAGATDCGKSTFAHILLNYSARRGRRCIYADLDVGQGSISIPGTVAAVAVDLPAPIGAAGDGRWTQRRSPIVHSYGETTPSANEDLYRRCIENLARDVRTLSDAPAGDAGGFRDGIIVNTCGWVDGLGYDLLVFAIEELRADSVVVIDNERLHSDLQRRFSGPETTHDGRDVKILKLSKSGGVVPRDSSFRRNSRTARIREYFYGDPLLELMQEGSQRSGLTAQAVIANPSLPMPLSPASTTIAFSEVVFLAVGTEPVAPLSALPLGAEPTQDPLHLSEISPTNVATLLHSVVAVSYADRAEDVLHTHTAGFVYITDINVHRQKITCIAPAPGPLPGKFLLVGHIKYLE